MNWREHLDAHPDVLFGKIVVKNTRIPVELILEKLGNGISTEELLAAYPVLTKETIQACLLFAADMARHEKIVAVA